jgi:hypothetical protein
LGDREMSKEVSSEKLVKDIRRRTRVWVQNLVDHSG